ncbi:MAG: baseplate J/gp47 family protein, partial [Kluyvera intermedia]
ASLLALQKQMSPGKTLQISALRTAIGSSSGVTDYTLSVNADITVPADELVTIGVLTWLTT